MEIKVQCGCGQKFKSDVEPINGKMPFSVNCPICGADGTGAANQILASALSVPRSAPASPTRIQVNRPAPVQVRVAEVAPPPIPAQARVADLAPAPVAAKPMVGAQPKSAKGANEFNIWLGTLGAFLGSGLGAGLMYGFYLMAGIRFPLLGVGIGALAGLGARLLYKGTDNKLGVISGAFALVSVVGTLYLMYGVFPILSIISVLVSVSVAYRIAS